MTASSPKITVEFSLGIDVDNTTGLYQDALRAHLNETQGVPYEQMPEVVSEDIWHDWPEVFPTPSVFFDAHSSAVLDGDIFLKMEPFEGAVEELTGFIDLGIEIDIMTHRFCTPENFDRDGEDKAGGQTVTWWKKLGLPIYVGHSPVVSLVVSHAKHRHVTDLFVDDRAVEVQKKLDRGHPAALMNHGSNAGPKFADMPRVHNWRELGILTRSLARAKEQGRPHDVDAMKKILEAIPLAIKLGANVVAQFENTGLVQVAHRPPVLPAALIDPVTDDADAPTLG